MSRFRRSNLVSLAAATIEFRHLHKIDQVPVSAKCPTGQQKRLFATVAAIPLRDVRSDETPTRWIVGIAGRKNGGSASKRIGRDASGGRALKLFAQEAGIIERAPVVPYTGNEKYRPEVTSAVLSNAQYEAFTSILDASPESLFKAIRMITTNGTTTVPVLDHTGYGQLLTVETTTDPIMVDLS